MRPEKYATSRLVTGFEKMRILTGDRIAQAWGNPSRITVFRQLTPWGARARYSPRGRSPTLDRLAAYDPNGRWSFRGVRCSRHGTLRETIVYRVEHSRPGYWAWELEARVPVRVPNVRADLQALQGLDREPLGDPYLYLSPPVGKEPWERRYETIRALPARAAAGRPEGPRERQESIRFRLSVLHEKQRRLYLRLESMRIGRGGDLEIARIAGVKVKTVAHGRRPLRARHVTAARIREAGGGRPALKKPAGIAGLEELRPEDTAGDPPSEKKWSRKDRRSIRRERTARGVRLGPQTVGPLLKPCPSSLRVNRQSIGETPPRDRHRPCELLADFRPRFADAGSPLLSLETKKKELLGNFKHAGRAGKKEPEPVNPHDLRSPASALVSP